MRKKRKVEPQVYVIYHQPPEFALIDPYVQLVWNDHHKKVGFRGEMHDTSELAKNLRMPCIDDAKIISAGGWVDPTQKECEGLWERGYEMRGEDVLALAIDLD